jgi:hypothetical protein
MARYISDPADGGNSSNERIDGTASRVSRTCWSGRADVLVKDDFDISEGPYSA